MYYFCTIQIGGVQVKKKEQLECLHSDDPPPPPPPPPPWLPILLSHIDPKSKEDKVKVANLKNSPIFQFFNFETSITREAPSQVAW